MWQIWALAAALAAVYLGMLAAGGKGIAKILPAVTLAVATVPVHPVVAAAFGFCAVGDLLLLDSQRWFLAGLAAFLVGHLMFVVAFASMGSGEPAVWAIAPVVAAAGAMVIVLFPHLRGALRFAVPAYAAALGWMAITASTLSPLAFAGGLVFIVSDALLAIDRFKAHIPGAHGWVMTTYYAAILMLGAAAIEAGA